MTGEVSVPRELNEAERAVLRRVLSVDFPGAAELRAQVEHAVVTAPWGDRSVSVDLEVDGDAARRADLPSGPVPVDASVSDADGSLLGEIIVWTGSGQLSAIEYAWYTDAAPTELPPPERVTVGTATT